MKRYNFPSPFYRLKSQENLTMKSDYLPVGYKTFAVKKVRNRSFSVLILNPFEAAPLLDQEAQTMLASQSKKKAEVFVFLLYAKQAEAEQAVLCGFCIVCNALSNDEKILTVAGQKTDKNFLELVLFRFYDESLALRGKTLLLRAIASHCRKREIDYIFGQFSFTGKYPAAYAEEFSCLYHYYRIKSNLLPHLSGAEDVSMDIMPAEAVLPDKTCRVLPPLLRYCLRLGARAGDRVVVDKNYDQGIGVMNVFLLMPTKPNLQWQEWRKT